MSAAVSPQEIKPEWSHAFSLAWLVFWRSWGIRIIIALVLPALVMAPPPLVMEDVGRVGNPDLPVKLIWNAGWTVLSVAITFLVVWMMIRKRRYHLTGFRLAVIRGTGGADMEEEIVIGWDQLPGVGWFVSWRLLIIFLARFLVVFLFEPSSDMGNFEPLGIPASIAIGLFLLEFLILIWVMKMALEKKYAGFRLAVVEPGGVSAAVSPQEIKPEWSHALSAGWLIFWRTLVISLPLFLPMLLYRLLFIDDSSPGDAWLGVGLLLILGLILFLPFWGVALFRNLSRMLKTRFRDFHLEVVPHAVADLPRREIIVKLWWRLMWSTFLTTLIFLYGIALIKVNVSPDQGFSALVLFTTMLIPFTLISFAGCVAGMKRAFGGGFSDFRLAVIKNGAANGEGGAA